MEYMAGWYSGYINQPSFNSEELKVRQLESIGNLIKVKSYKLCLNYNIGASSISQKLDADVFICGSIKKQMA